MLVSVVWLLCQWPLPSHTKGHLGTGFIGSIPSSPPFFSPVTGGKASWPYWCYWKWSAQKENIAFFIHYFSYIHRIKILEYVSVCDTENYYLVKACCSWMIAGLGCAFNALNRLWYKRSQWNKCIQSHGKANNEHNLQKCLSHSFNLIQY